MTMFADALKVFLTVKSTILALINPSAADDTIIRTLDICFNSGVTTPIASPASWILDWRGYII